MGLHETTKDQWLQTLQALDIYGEIGNNKSETEQEICSLLAINPNQLQAFLSVLTAKLRFIHCAPLRDRPLAATR